MKINEGFIKSEINDMKIHCFHNIKEIAKNSADFNKIYKELTKCDTKIFLIQKISSIKDILKGDLSEDL